MNKTVAKARLQRYSLPTSGELREPIVLFRSDRQPNNSIGYTQTLTKYDNRWAKVEEFTVRWNGGVQCDPYVAHRFTVRNNEQLQIEDRDFVNWKGRLFKVDSFQYVDTERVWITLFCREDVNLKSPNLVKKSCSTAHFKSRLAVGADMFLKFSI